MAEEGNAQWQKLQAMRKDRGEPVTPEPKVNEVEGAEAKKLVAEQPRDAEGKFVKAEPPVEPVTASAPETKSEPVITKPAYAEIDIDGVKVSVDPLLAAAFSKAEKTKQDVAKATEREALKSELRDELRAELVPVKTPAEKAIEAAMKAAEEAAKLPKEPDSKLLIENPEQWKTEQKAYDDARIKAAIADAKAETLAEIHKQQAAAAVTAEQQAREALREQFFTAYPVLKDSADMVVPLLEQKLTEIAKSGKVTKLTATEREALKSTEFADVAAKATRKIVNLMNQGKKIVPPAPPPTLASSAPVKPANPEAKAPEPEKKAKYPAGSVSALLAARKASRESSAA